MWHTYHCLLCPNSLSVRILDFRSLFMKEGVVSMMWWSTVKLVVVSLACCSMHLFLWMLLCAKVWHKEMLYKSDVKCHKVNFWNFSLICKGLDVQICGQTICVHLDMGIWLLKYQFEWWVDSEYSFVWKTAVLQSHWWITMHPTVKQDAATPVPPVSLRELSVNIVKRFAGV